MHRVLAALATISVLSGSALAADLPITKGPPVFTAAPVAYDWSGVYGQIGLGWGSNSYRWEYANPAPATLSPFSARKSGLAGLGMIGVQKQWGNFVVGVEAGVAGLLNSGFSSTSGDGTATTICVSAAPAVCQMRLSNPITMVGGKLGFASNDWLFYGVAGGAWSKINSRFVNAAGVVFDNAGGSLNGYYVGLGVNYAWIKSQSLDVIFGLEYRHVDLGKKLFQSSADANINGSNGRRLGARSDMILGIMEVKFNMFR